MRTLALLLALAGLGGDVANGNRPFREAVAPQRNLNSADQKYNNPFGTTLPENPQNHPIEACGSGSVFPGANSIVFTRLRGVTADLTAMAMVAFAGNSNAGASLNVGMGLYEFSGVGNDFVMKLVDYGWTTTTDVGGAQSPISVIPLTTRPVLQKRKRYMVGMVVSDGQVDDAVRVVLPSSMASNTTLVGSMSTAASYVLGDAFPLAVNQIDVFPAYLVGGGVLWAMVATNESEDLGAALFPGSTPGTKIFF